MKILLISPYLSPTDRYGEALGKVGPTTEPLGLAYLASALRNKNHEVEILDAVVLNLTPDKLSSYLDDSYDVVGVMMLTPMYLRSKETIEFVRKCLPDVKIVAGGPHITIFPVQTLKEIPELDIGVVGEGEITIVELTNALQNKKSLSGVKGIVFRDDKKITLTEPRPFIKNLDEIPLPARDLLDMEKYKPAPTYYMKLPSFIILTSRGCPFRCVYCSKMFGQLYRHHSVERVIKEIELLVNNYNAKEIIFRDDTFTIKRSFVVDLCKEMINKGINKKIRWTCMTRVDIVDENLLQLMADAGCWSIHYGVESGSQRLLNLIQKDITLQQVKDAFKWTKKAGIEIKAFFMLGLPTETREESLQTINFARNCGADWIQVTITVPYPGTKLFELAQKDGSLKSMKWEDYQTWAGWSGKDLVYIPSNRTAVEIKELQKKAMRDFYLQPRFIARHLLKLRPGNIKTYVSGAVAIIKSKFKN